MYVEYACISRSRTALTRIIPSVNERPVRIFGVYLGGELVCTGDRYKIAAEYGTPPSYVADSAETGYMYAGVYRVKWLYTKCGEEIVDVPMRRE